MVIDYGCLLFGHNSLFSDIFPKLFFTTMNLKKSKISSDNYLGKYFPILCENDRKNLIGDEKVKLFNTFIKRHSNAHLYKCKSNKNKSST